MLRSLERNNFSYPIMEAFVFLQVLDLLTTVIGFKHGGVEVSPAIRIYMHVSNPVHGVIISKMIALMLGGYCISKGRSGLFKLVTYFFGGLVLWNLLQFLK